MKSATNLIVCAVAGSLLVVTLAAQTSTTSGADLHASVVKLFEAGAKSTPAALADANGQYDQLKRNFGGKDSRLDYAYAVALVNQHKYREALPLASRYIESHPRDHAAQRFMMWALIQDKRSVDAVDQAVAMAKSFPESPVGDPNDELLEGAKFLGTCFGYLELARPGVGDANLRTERKNQVLARLGKPYISAFDEGRDNVAKEVAAFKDQREAAQDQITAAAEVRQELNKSAIEKNKEKIADRHIAIQTSQQELNEAERELNVLQTQLASLQKDRTQIGVKIVVVQSQITQLQPDYFNGLTGVASYLKSPPDVQARLRSFALGLSALNKQAFDMDRKILALQAKAAEASGRGSEGIQSREKSSAAIREAEKRAKIAEKQLRKPVPTSNPRIAAINAKMTNFATYAPFPYEQEKQRVLGWFAK